jgi:formylglycine-generating enzyme required for sulfatase activity
LRPFKNEDRRALLGLGLLITLFVFSQMALPDTKRSLAFSKTDDSGMVRIPAGPFLLGTNERLPDEGPMHTVYVPEFFMDQYEVTNTQYKQFVRAVNRTPPIYWRGGEPPPGKANHPIVFVTWYDANDYCHWAGKRLPTATEWEKAARGVDGRMYPWGNVFDPAKANTPYSKRGDTTPVGSFPGGRSPYGVYDMSGNVWEWTASWYKAYPGNTKRRLETYGERYRVLKGGSFVNCSFYKCGISAPTFNRSFFRPATRNQGFGFRCSKSENRSMG